MAYCSQSDLENALGGADKLVELLDKDGDGIADTAIVTAILNRASAEVNSAVQVVIDLSNLVAPYPDALIYNTADIGAYYAYLDGTSGQAVPENVKLRYDNAIKWLDQVATRQRTLGIASKPATGLDVQQIDPDADSTKVSRTSLKGFW